MPCKIRHCFCPRFLGVYQICTLKTIMKRRVFDDHFMGGSGGLSGEISISLCFKTKQIHVDIRVLKYVMQRITTHLSPARTRFSSYSCVRRYDKCLSKFLKTA